MSKRVSLEGFLKNYHIFKRSWGFGPIYPSGDNFDLIRYVDADYAEYLVDRENNSKMAHFHGSSLISWGSKKQNLVVLSIAEAEYIADASCYAHYSGLRRIIYTIPLIRDNTMLLIFQNPYVTQED